MRLFNTKLAALTLVGIALLGSPAIGDEVDSSSELDANLMIAARYLDTIRDDELAPPQVIKKATMALVSLAGQRNHLSAQDGEIERWIAHYNAGLEDLEALEKRFKGSRTRISASEAAKILGLVRRMAGALKAVDGRLTKAEDLSAKIYPRLVSMAEGLVAFLADILHENGYGSVIEESPSEDEVLPKSRIPSASDLSKTARLLRDMRGLVDGVGPKMHDARALRAKAYERLAPSQWHLDKLLQEILRQTNVA